MKGAPDDNEINPKNIGNINIYPRIESEQKKEQFCLVCDPIWIQ